VDSLKLLNWATELQRQEQNIHTRTTSGLAATTEQQIEELTQLLQLLQNIEEGISKMRGIIEPKLKTLKTQVTPERVWWSELDPKWKNVFKDKNNLIENAEPTEEELQHIFQKVQVLKCNEMGLTSLEPLRVLTGLQDLECVGNKLTSLEPLRTLTGLQTLKCGSNQLTSLEPLRALTGLQTLCCGWNQLTSLEPLHGLKNLKKLDCQRNPSLSPQEIERFKKAVPACEVVS